MRKFSIIGHYFITPGRYSCPGVSPARGGWPWNAGNAPVCGGAGEGRESEGRFRERWFRRWFREWFRELVVAGMVSRPVPGGGCRMVSGGVGASESRFRGRRFQRCFRGGCGSRRRSVCDFGSGSGGGGVRGCFRSGSGRMRGWFPGVVSGAGTGMAAGRRTGMCGREGLGLPGAARGREYTDFSGGRCALIILFVADY